MGILKKIVTTFFLFLFSVTVLRWIVIFAIMLVAIPVFFIIQIIKTNPQNLRLNIYDMPFPLVYMNSSFEKAFPFFREVIMTTSLCIALAIFGIYILRNVFQVHKPFERMLSSFFKQKRVLFSLGLLFFLLLIFAYFLFIPVTKIVLVMKTTVPLVKEDVFLLKENNFPELEKNNKIIKNNLAVIKKDYNSLKYLSYIPLIKIYYGDGNHLIKASENTLDILSMVGEIRSNLTVNSLEQTETFIPKVEVLLGDFSLVGKELTAIDSNRYPTALGKYKIRENIILVQNTFNEFEVYKQNIPTVISQLQSILGTTDKPAHYLLVYYHRNPVNQKIQYPLTMGKFQLVQGKFEPEGSVDLSGYFKNNSGQITQTVSFANFKSTVLDTGYTNLTGVITVNGNFLEKLLKVTGPVQVLDKVFTANIDGECRCPQIIKTLNEYSINSPNEIIGTIFNGILYKIKSLDSQKLLALIPVTNESYQRNDITVFFFDPVLSKITTSFPKASL